LEQFLIEEALVYGYEQRAEAQERREANRAEAHERAQDGLRAFQARRAASPQAWPERA